MNDLLKEIIASFSLDDYRPIQTRELLLGGVSAPKRGNLVTVVTGIRRCGKTYRLFQEMDRLLHSGVPKEHLLYFNFEDERLKPFSADLANHVLETWFALNPSARAQGAYLFFDEIQVVPGWEVWLRRIVDTEKVTIYVTGSSAKLLSHDIATAFRGRAVGLELTPFSFREYVRWHTQINPAKKAYSSLERTHLTALMDEYLVQGGFPAVQNLPRNRAILVLQDYADRVVTADVVERYGLSNLRLASLFVQRVIAYNGRELSLRKAEHAFKSAGITAPRAQLADLLGYFEDAYLIAPVRPFTRALAENTRSALKIYAVDSGMAHAHFPAATRDIAQYLEQIVYLELRRRNPLLRCGTISTAKTTSGFEVDFIVGDALSDTGYALYQVATSLDDAATRERELRALRAAMEQYHLETATLITRNEEGSVDLSLGVGTGQVKIIPAWKWCLGKGAGLDD